MNVDDTINLSGWKVEITPQNITLTDTTQNKVTVTAAKALFGARHYATQKLSCKIKKDRLIAMAKTIWGEKFTEDFSREQQHVAAHFLLTYIHGSGGKEIQVSRDKVKGMIARRNRFLSTRSSAEKVSLSSDYMTEEEIVKKIQEKDQKISKQAVRAALNAFVAKGGKKILNPKRQEFQYCFVSSGYDLDALYLSSLINSWKDSLLAGTLNCDVVIAALKDEAILSSRDEAVREELSRFRELLFKSVSSQGPKEEIDLLRQRAEGAGKDSLPEVCKTIVVALNLMKASSRAKEIGNKSANLERLAEIFRGTKDVVIPKFQAIPHEKVEQYLKQHCAGFESIWKEFVAVAKSGEPIESDKSVAILKRLQEAIVKTFTESPPEFLSEAFLSSFKDKPLMVRSTGEEDSLKVANPGGNVSIANVTPNVASVAEAMGSVVASHFSAKSLGQRKAVGDDICKEPFVPVLLQEMVSEATLQTIPVSGVMYTTEGDLGTPGAVQINATFGHAENVVTGTEACDTYYVHNGFEHGIIREKPTRKAPQSSGGLHDVANEKPHMPSFSKKAQFRRLARIGKKIEEAYGYPMDVE